MKEQLRMDLSESDVGEGVIQYFKRCYDIIEQHGWKQYITGTDGRQQAATMSYLDSIPQVLHDKVKRTIRFQRRKAKEDEVVLHDLILEKSLNHEKAFHSKKRIRRDCDESNSGRPPAKQTNPKSVKKLKPSKEQRLAAPRPFTKGSTDRPNVPPTSCLHCSEMHWLSECKTVTDDQKAKIRHKLRAQRDSDEGKRTVAQGSAVKEVLAVPYCADTGADGTAISRHHVDKLCQRASSVIIQQLSAPIVGITVGEYEVTCSSSVEIRPQLNTAAGPVALQGAVECLIIEGEEPEFILGQDVLLSLGIDVDRQLEQLVTRNDNGEDGEGELKDDLPDLAPTSTNEALQTGLDRLVTVALANGFPPRLERDLRAIVLKHDIWRLELGKDPQAHARPLKIRLKAGANAVKSKSRQYPPAPLGKPSVTSAKSGQGDDEFRQTCDYRLVNDLIETFGFWHLPLPSECEELMSYITDRKLYTPRRVPQGCCDVAVHFQQTMEHCFESLLYHSLVIWIDDLLFFADGIDTNFAELERFFDLVASFGLKLSAKTSCLYRQSVKWCGRIISKDGAAHDPARIDTLPEIPCPVTAGKLQQF
ncbi:LOW QUALITY PROTEIN: hypothetical protein PHMEG_00028190 [Phytophthora megakarya]|uniref:Reverse transcriptase domain-containing protein n=1 Tax=Phytophthora megakarya TaxID=4795 RepID=A0A225V639_9STRA|nr:LOW QUALITY PROTEIN: hypothetical protein PHMEG_00028190 [Phytophthora megakarya]